MQTVSLLVHLTDRTVPAVRLCCQSIVQWFVVSGEVLKVLQRHVTSRYDHHFNNVTLLLRPNKMSCLNDQVV
jgi:hypothetical protein